MDYYILDNIKVPKFFYGTAWKDEKTAILTNLALTAGFRAIDTANQRKHYFEEAVGEGIQNFFSTQLSRDDLFLQTKFTFARGQDHRKPYNETDEIKTQVMDSFKSSLKHLHTDRIDSYVLHGPYTGSGIVDEDWQAWEAMEALYQRGQIRFLGISNVNSTQLLKLCESVKVPPRFVQNRCYAESQWDKEIREICKSKNILYQGFSLLTANSREITKPAIQSIAKKYQKTIPQIIFKFCHHVGMITLTGSSNPQHLSEDLDIQEFALTDNEISIIEGISN